MLWARTTEVRRGQRRKENSLGTEWQQARQIYWGERCHPISYCIFKQEYTGHGPFRIPSSCSRRQEQSSSYLPGLKNIDAKTDEGPLSRLFVSSVYNKVWKDYIFSSKHSLSGPSELPQFHSPALMCCSKQHVLSSTRYCLLPPCSHCVCAAFLQFPPHNHSGTSTQLLYKQCSWLLQTTEALLICSLQALGQP